MDEPIAFRRPIHLRRPGIFAAAGAALLVVGGAAGAVMMAETRPSVSMVPATPVAIRSLASSGIFTVRGRVAEVFGNKFVLSDATGRALVDTGPEGDDARLVTPGEPVTVQGRFDRGFIHAAFLVGPDNKVTALGPLAGPPHGRRDRRDGPDRDIAGPPPPGAGDAPSVTSVAPAAASGSATQTPPGSTR